MIFWGLLFEYDKCLAYIQGFKLFGVVLGQETLLDVALNLIKTKKLNLFI